MPADDGGTAEGIHAESPCRYHQLCIDDAARFTGSITEQYDQGLGPHIFQGYAVDLARRVAAAAPTAVLELAAGTGIVTRQLRNLLSADCALTASDLNPPMLDVAREVPARGGCAL